MHESELEAASLSWLESVGYSYVDGPSLSAGPDPERSTLSDVRLRRRMRAALYRLNGGASSDALEEAYQKLTEPSDASSAAAANRSMHRLIVEGITVEYRRIDGSFGATTVRVVDFDHPNENDWLAVRQLTVTENKRSRRFDLVLFVNGLPLVVCELKSPADQGATIWAAYKQIQTYKREIPSLFHTNSALIISDGVEARVGSLTATREQFMPWRADDNSQKSAVIMPELQVVLQGAFEPTRFLQLLRYFTVFEALEGGELSKKLAGYHQIEAVNTALVETLRATGKGTAALAPHAVSNSHLTLSDCKADRRIGVVWHTQGSGKSLTMAFYAGRVILAPEMENPTIVVLTDRNDLDEQLFQTFCRCSDLIRQLPVQAQSRLDLREKLTVDGGGVVFTTIQKFVDNNDASSEERLLSNRENVIVIADEAHRGQYEFVDGLASQMRQALPKASFIGFTGTPIERSDAGTLAVFGNYISIYDVRRAVVDRATVPIYYEARFSKLRLLASERAAIDVDFEEVTEGEELEHKEGLKRKWSQLEAIVGADKVIDALARDLVDHFEKRLEVLDGKGMIVAMSRRICVQLYDAIVQLRPQWHSEDDLAGDLKVIMTGSASDPWQWQPHIRSKQRRELLAQRFRNPTDSFKLVIVRDMWLTGFDVPPLHTMYLDKPMRGHNLMQAIARVNRVFRNKPGGLVVDYLGLADELRQALIAYSDAGGGGTAVLDQGEAVALMIKAYEVCAAMFHGFERSAWSQGGSPMERVGLLPGAQEHLLSQSDGKQQFLAAFAELSRALALAVPSQEALALRDELRFFQTIASVLAKRATSTSTRSEELDYAMRQMVSCAAVSDDIVDMFSAAGLRNADFGILSNEVLNEISSMAHKHLAVDILEKILAAQIRMTATRNVVKGGSFAELLDAVLRRYRKRPLEVGRVVEELIVLARDLRELGARGEVFGLSQEELAFYDALGVSDCAVQVLGDEQLRDIARELTRAVRSNVSIDWTVRESVRAKLRVIVKRVLRKYGYPPEKQEKAADTVLEQAALLSQNWATIKQ